MKKSILNLGKALNKAEQQTINGGYVKEEGSGSCCLSWNNTGYKDCGYSVAEAQWKFNSKWNPAGGSNAGQTVTGYCCASC